MCGIVGMAGQLTAETDKIFKNLLILDTLRGTDSTGIAAIDRTDDVRVVKQIGSPFELFQYKTFDSALAKNNRAIIGHNRYATSGDVTRKNAHPFEFDKVVGVHNGTLFGRYKLLDSNMFKVDSENLYWHMNEKGLDDLLNVLDGAWSLVWWNKEDKTLNFLRNKERPMWITQSKDNKVIAWASEPWMLDVGCSRGDHKLEFQEPVSTKIDHHYSFFIGEDRVISAPEIRLAESKCPPTDYGYRGNFHYGQKGFAGANSAQQQQRQQSNVLAFEALKKARVTPETVTKVQEAPSKNFYAGRKDVLLEVLCKSRDKHGAEYLVCFDPLNRNARIRLYVKRDSEIEQMVNKEILCTVGPKVFDGKDGIYHKVEYSSVRLSPNCISHEGDSEDDEVNGKYFMDAKGKLLPVREWEAKYPQCGWCTATVFGSEPNRFTQEGDIICPECSKDEEITQYITLV